MPSLSLLICIILFFFNFLLPILLHYSLLSIPLSFIARVPQVPIMNATTLVPLELMDPSYQHMYHFIQEALPWLRYRHLFKNTIKSYSYKIFPSTRVDINIGYIVDKWFHYKQRFVIFEFRGIFIYFTHSYLYLRERHGLNFSIL